MAKKRHTVKLTGYGEGFNKARIGAEVKTFSKLAKAADKVFSIRVHVSPFGEATLTTAKGTYTLKQHPTANRYEGIANGVKVHFCPKKITAQLLYWA